MASLPVTTHKTRLPNLLDSPIRFSCSGVRTDLAKIESTPLRHIEQEILRFGVEPQVGGLLRGILRCSGQERDQVLQKGGVVVTTSKMGSDGNLAIGSANQGELGGSGLGCARMLVIYYLGCS